MKKSSKKLLSYALSSCICFTASAGSINAESAKALSDDILSVSSDLVSKVSLFDVSSADRLWAKYYTYEVTEDSEIMITGTVSDTKTDLIIPDYIDDMPVTVIGDEAFYGKGINSIQLPSNLKKIGNSAFKECSITSVDISKTMITEIGNSAFNGCKIEEITFPDTLETIGEYSFANTNLKTVYVPDSVKSIGKGCFYNCNSLLYADTGNGITTINEYMFAECYNVRQIHISDNTKKICEFAFDNCSKLEIMNLPSGVEKIDLLAFTFTNSNIFTISGYKEAYEKASGADSWMQFIEPLEKNEKVYESTSAEWEDYFEYFITAENEAVISGIISDELSDIVVPESIDGYPVTRISCFAFKNSSFKNIALPSTLEQIGVQSFEKSEIENISIPEGIETIPYSAFKDSNLQSIIFPKTGLKKIGNYAFSGCKIEEISFPNTLETICEYAFENANLKTVHLPDSVKSIGNSCFSGCRSLLYADTGNGITTINAYLFSGCDNIRQIHISDNTRKICDYAFVGCSKLEIVNLPSGVEEIELNAFDDLNSDIFYLSGDIEVCEKASEPYKEAHEKLYENMTGEKLELENFNQWEWIRFVEPMEKNEKVYENSSSGQEDYYDYVITAENDILILGIKNNSSGNIVIPESIEGKPVTAISYGVFQNTHVTCVEFPKTLKRIGAYAFSHNDALKNLIIPGNVKYIGNSAFSNCTALEKITLNSGLTKIGNVFENCTALKSVKIPETVTTIYNNAFSGCENLNTIYGKPETYAEEYAFINNYEFINSDEIIDIEPEYSSGDINGDGSVSVSDMLLLKRYILLADTEINERADINKDGKINIFDFARLKNIILTPIKDDTEVTSEWKKAYLKCINENTDPQNIKYSLAYIDNDEIPELIIGNEYYTGTGICGLYSFYNNSLVELESLSFRKYMSKYIEKGNAFIINWFWLADEGHIAFRIENGVTVETDSFSHSRQTGEYSINDKVVSEEEYNLKYQEYTSSFSEVKYCTYSEIIEQLN